LRALAEAITAYERQFGVISETELVAHDRDLLLTSDPGDLEPLARETRRDVSVVLV